MTRDDIICMALEAGFDKWENNCCSGDSDLDETLAVGEYAVGEAVFKFAALIAAAEREECAKVALDYDQHAIAPAAIANAIRARGK